MRLNKKGFTLVELLAVIVVLAIIALIGFTAVGPIVESSRKSAAENNILQYEHALKVGCAAYQAENTTASTISVANALSKAKFDGTAPEAATGSEWSFGGNNKSTCDLNSPSSATSLNRSCTYTADTKTWKCN